MLKYLFLCVLFTNACLEVAGGNTNQCRHCDNAKSPEHCKHFQHCHEGCTTAVTKHNGEFVFHYGCNIGPGCSFGTLHHIHDNTPVVCHECCLENSCDQNLCSNFFPSAIHSPTPVHPNTTTTNQTTTNPTTMVPTITSTSAVSATPQAAIVSKKCDRLGVIGGLVLGKKATASCPDGIHQPSEALVQKFCNAPSKANWTQGTKVMDNCPAIPHYTAVAAVTSAFGGSTYAGIFIKCEAGGFKVALQTCSSDLTLYHVSANSQPSADKFVTLNWN